MGMYLGIDIGGTKTLLGVLTDDGVITEQHKFPTPKNYDDFLKELAKAVDKLSTKEFIACGLAVPGKVDRERGLVLDMGNLTWADLPIQSDVSKITHCPVAFDNDANLAGLSEAMLLKHQYSRVLYVTISTGIGTGIIVDQKIDPGMQDSEGGHMVLEHHGQLKIWESFASGKAIVTRFGKQAHEITDEKTWDIIAHDIALGLIELIAIIQPQVIVLGGGVGASFERLETPLHKILARYSTPLVPIPPIMKAQRPEEAVVYGCYDLAKSVYGKTR